MPQPTTDKQVAKGLRQWAENMEEQVKVARDIAGKIDPNGDTPRKAPKRRGSKRGGRRRSTRTVQTPQA